jgi:hypothetical protein
MPRVVTEAMYNLMKSGAAASIFMLTASGAFAGQTDDVAARLAVLEKENAAIRKENAALRENKVLRARNASLKWAAPAPQPSASISAKPATGTKPSVFEAMAADLPVAYKAPPPESPGQFRVWAEGGAIWSGGDPVSQDFNLIDFTGIGGLAGLGGGIGFGTIPRHFDLTPKVGWEAATGFDYRIAGSPWHVSGQFRYGEGGKTSGSASTSGVIDPALLALLGGGGGVVGVFGGSENVSASYKETHWLADLALGRDVIGNGRDALQLKGGFRVAEFVTTTNTVDSVNNFANLAAPAVILPGIPAISAYSISTSAVTNARNNFLGAGPLIGIQGSVPFAGNWAFDYLGDAAVLFGTQNSTSTTTTTTAFSPAILAVLGGGGGGAFTTNAQRFATVFSADIQVGISYWVTQNLKVGASYRLDALINVQNQQDPAVANLLPDRYTHGPRLTVTGQF